MRKSRIGAGGVALAAICTAFIPAYAAQASTHASTSAFTRQVTSSQSTDNPGAIRVNNVRPESTNGCVSGAVCMYTDWDWFWNSPEHSWTIYQCYNLAGETGDRHVFNNQTGGHTARLWTGYGCTGHATTIDAGTTWQGNITPINSISLDN